MDEQKMVIKFPEADPKKHSIRYNSGDPRLGSVYISRLGLQGTFGREPKAIQITIEVLED